MLEFKGTTIPGSHGPILVGSPEAHLRRVKYWDLVGEGEVAGQNGARNLMVEITIHNKWTQAKPDKLFDFLDKLDALVGENGTLEESGNVARKLKNCTFDGYEPVPLPGQIDAGPLKDAAGTLRDDNGVADSGWFQTFNLRFRQLVT